MLGNAGSNPIANNNFNNFGNKKAVANSTELKLKKAQHSATVAANKEYIRQVNAERKKAKAKPKGAKPRGKK